MNERLSAEAETGLSTERVQEFAVRLEALARQYQVGGEAGQAQRDISNAMTSARMLKTDIETNVAILETNTIRLNQRLLELGDTRLHLTESALLEANGAEILQVTGELAKNNALTVKAKHMVSACEQDIATLEQRLAQCRAYHAQWSEVLAHIAPLMEGIQGLEAIGELSKDMLTYGDPGELAARVQSVPASQATFSVQVMGIVNDAMRSAQDIHAVTPYAVGTTPIDEVATEVLPRPTNTLLPALDLARLNSVMGDVS